MTDGWNREYLNDVILTCEDIYDLTYELKNCVRGCYTGAENYENLAKYIKQLGEQLITDANDLALDAKRYDEADLEEDDEY